MPSHVLASVMCPICPKASSSQIAWAFRPAHVIVNTANLQARRGSWPGARLAQKNGLTDDFVLGKELADFLKRRFRRVRPVDGVLADRLRVHFPNRTRRCLGGIGRAHDVAVTCDGVVALKYLNNDGARDHEIDELAEERALLMHRIE